MYDYYNSIVKADANNVIRISKILSCMDDMKAILNLKSLF